jgi:hypothetical protein
MEGSGDLPAVGWMMDGWMKEWKNERGVDLFWMESVFRQRKCSDVWEILFRDDLRNCRLPSRCLFVDGADYLGLDGGSEGVINRRGGVYNGLDWTTVIKGQMIFILARVLLAPAYMLL